MKLTRPAIAVAAAALVAAGSIPVVHHVSASGEDAPAVLSAAQSTVQSSLPEATTETTAPTETSTEPSPSETTTSGETTTSVPESSTSVATTEPAPEGASKPIPENADLTVDDADNTSGATGNTVLELGDAPRAMGGKNQRWVGILQRAQSQWPNAAVRVHSESMGRDIPVAVFFAQDAQGKRVDNAPTVYLLNGAGGSEQDTDWVSQSYKELYETYGHAGANVVIPMEGAFSYYVDWAAEPPVEEGHLFYKGKQMWSTFLADELPNAIEPYMNADRERRGIAGLSMAATSVLLLAEHNPGFYDAVGSFSGCAATSTPIPNFFVQLTVDRGAPGKMTPEHIFGPMGSDYNRHYDALVNAPKLAGTGTKLYVSTGTGLAAETDMPGTLAKRFEDAGLNSSDAFIKGSANAATLIFEGGAIEGAMNSCTHDLLVKLRANGAEVEHAELRNVGTHAWPVWRDDLKKSYDTVFKSALGL